ncbi:MAG: beta-eliminating lyase-related protein [Betaproteobacteria bacterium]|nr:beta-eliminating lyase-related protein [Betaproteobacteria bacterium]
MKFFASDNYAGAHPKVLDAVQKANTGDARAYGTDPWCQEAGALLREAFGENSRVFFALSGTAANVLGLKALLRPYQSVICTNTAHIATDECGAVEAACLSKIETVPGKNGKLCLSSLERFPERRKEVHYPYPKVLSVAQLTEVGTRYIAGEIKALSSWCRENGFYLHMDGARLANAAAGAGVSLKAFTAEAGVDVLSFGGTKNGLLYGEAVVFFDPQLAEDFGRIQKQGMQLLSKMRYVGAQFTAYMTDDLWRSNALNANNMAALLHHEIKDLPDLALVYPVEGNILFVRMHKDNIAKLNASFYFYTIDASDAENFPSDWFLVRLMTSFSTTPEEVMEFVQAIRRCCS